MQAKDSQTAGAVRLPLLQALCIQRGIVVIPKGSKLLDLLPDEEKVKYLAAKQEKKIEKSNAQKVFRRLNNMIKKIGFIRKGNSFARESTYVAHVIHFHKYTYGPCFRMHVFMRVLNDPTDFIALNGLHSEELRSWQQKFKYENSEESIIRCAELMCQAIEEVAVPWFASANLERLDLEKHLLTESGYAALQAALAGNSDIVNVNRSRKLLGLK